MVKMLSDGHTKEREENGTEKTGCSEGEWER